MESFWFVAICGMFTVYVILDGFDLGAGAIQPVAARTPKERARILAAIGPFWDGNEVWLIAAGGTLYFSFPAVYASGFSGFYLPLFMLLWLLILRGLAIELRGHLQNALWQVFWDRIFAAASVLLAFILGVALGNLIRGVPISESGHFFVPLWTDFRPHGSLGVLDWYTVVFGLLSTSALAAHGALFVAGKTDGPLQQRARTVAGRAQLATAVLSVSALAATTWVSPRFLAKFTATPALLLFAVLAAAGFAGIRYFQRSGRDWAAFFSSCVFIGAAGAATAAGLYPDLLHNAAGSAASLSVDNAASGKHGLAAALIWWPAGMLGVCFSFFMLYRTFRGKVPEEP